MNTGSNFILVNHIMDEVRRLRLLVGVSALLLVLPWLVVVHAPVIVHK